MLGVRFCFCEVASSLWLIRIFISYVYCRILLSWINVFILFNGHPSLTSNFGLYFFRYLPSAISNPQHLKLFFISLKSSRLQMYNRVWVLHAYLSHKCSFVTKAFDNPLGQCHWQKFYYSMAGLSERMISALCVNNTLTSLKLARNGLRKLICVLFVTK